MAEFDRVVTVMQRSYRIRMLSYIVSTRCLKFDFRKGTKFFEAWKVNVYGDFGKPEHPCASNFFTRFGENSRNVDRAKVGLRNPQETWKMCRLTLGFLGVH